MERYTRNIIWYYVYELGVFERKKSSEEKNHQYVVVGCYVIFEKALIFTVR